MKMVVAIIRPDRLPGVELALKKAKAELMTVTETQSYGQEERRPLIYRNSVIPVRTSPKVRVEILTEDVGADKVVAMLRAGSCGSANSKNADRIYVVSLDHYPDPSERGREAVPSHSR